MTLGGGFLMAGVSSPEDDEEEEAGLSDSLSESDSNRFLFSAGRALPPLPFLGGGWGWWWCLPLPFLPSPPLPPHIRSAAKAPHPHTPTALPPPSVATEWACKAFKGPTVASTGGRAPTPSAAEHGQPKRGVLGEELVEPPQPHAPLPVLVTPNDTDGANIVPAERHVLDLQQNRRWLWSG